MESSSLLGTGRWRQKPKGEMLLFWTVSVLFYLGVLTEAAQHRSVAGQFRSEKSVDNPELQAREAMDSTELPRTLQAFPGQGYVPWASFVPSANSASWQQFIPTYVRTAVFPNDVATETLDNLRWQQNVAAAPVELQAENNQLTTPDGQSGFNQPQVIPTNVRTAVLPNAPHGRTAPDFIREQAFPSVPAGLVQNQAPNQRGGTDFSWQQFVPRFGGTGSASNAVSGTRRLTAPLSSDLQSVRTSGKFQERQLKRSLPRRLQVDPNAFFSWGQQPQSQFWPLQIPRALPFPQTSTLLQQPSAPFPMMMQPQQLPGMPQELQRMQQQASQLQNQVNEEVQQKLRSQLNQLHTWRTPNGGVVYGRFGSATASASSASYSSSQSNAQGTQQQESQPPQESTLPPQAPPQQGEAPPLDIDALMQDLQKEQKKPENKTSADSTSDPGLPELLNPDLLTDFPTAEGSPPQQRRLLGLMGYQHDQVANSQYRDRMERPYGQASAGSSRRALQYGFPWPQFVPNWRQFVPPAPAGWRPGASGPLQSEPVPLAFGQQTGWRNPAALDEQELTPKATPASQPDLRQQGPARHRAGGSATTEASSSSISGEHLDFNKLQRLQNEQLVRLQEAHALQRQQLHSALSAELKELHEQQREQQKELRERHQEQLRGQPEQDPELLQHEREQLNASQLLQLKKLQDRQEILLNRLQLEQMAQMKQLLLDQQIQLERLQRLETLEKALQAQEQETAEKLKKLTGQDASDVNAEKDVADHGDRDHQEKTGGQPGVKGDEEQTDSDTGEELRKEVEAREDTPEEPETSGLEEEQTDTNTGEEHKKEVEAREDTPEEPETSGLEETLTGRPHGTGSASPSDSLQSEEHDEDVTPDHDESTDGHESDGEETRDSGEAEQGHEGKSQSQNEPDTDTQVPEENEPH